MNKTVALRSSIIESSVALVAVISLLPWAFGIPSIASPAIPFADALWFIVHLAGPLLFLAAGLRSLISGVTTRVFIAGFSALLLLAGIVPLWVSGFHRLAVGWFAMAVVLGVVLLRLHRTRQWAIIGSLWTALLLGVYSFEIIVLYVGSAYESGSLPSFPVLILMQPLLTVLVLVCAIRHLRLRENRSTTTI